MDDPKITFIGNERPTVPPLDSAYRAEAVDEERELLKNADVRTLVVLLFGKLDHVIVQFAAQVAARDEERDQDAAKRDVDLTKALDHTADELEELIGKVAGSMQGLTNLTSEVMKLIEWRERTDDRLDALEKREIELTSELAELRDSRKPDAR